MFNNTHTHTDYQHLPNHPRPLHSFPFATRSDLGCSPQGPVDPASMMIPWYALLGAESSVLVGSFSSSGTEQTEQKSQAKATRPLRHMRPQRRRGLEPAVRDGGDEQGR